jgi:hypothetical protein
MAFVRWRGNCAQLLATVYRDGRSHQVLLTTFWGITVPLSVRQEVEERFPTIPVDWIAVERALARGPKEKPAPQEHLTWAEIDSRLRELAADIARLKGWHDHAETLRAAAYVLESWRAWNLNLDALREAHPMTPDDGTPPDDAAAPRPPPSMACAHVWHPPRKSYPLAPPLPPRFDDT